MATRRSAMVIEMSSIRPFPTIVIPRAWRDNFLQGKREQINSLVHYAMAQYSKVEFRYSFKASDRIEILFKLSNIQANHVVKSRTVSRLEPQLGLIDQIGRSIFAAARAIGRCDDDAVMEELVSMAGDLDNLNTLIEAEAKEEGK